MTKSPTSLLAWWGSKTSLTAIQNWVTDMAMKTSAQKQKAMTKTGNWYSIADWAQSRKRTPDESATGVWTWPIRWTSKTYQKAPRLAMKNRIEAVR